MKSKGFTLIELLVVIAIIGILSGIVLTSLGSARSKAKDASVQGSLSSARAQAEIYYAGTYEGVCAATAANNGLEALIDAARLNNALSVSENLDDPTPGAYNLVTCHDTSAGWALEAPMSTSVVAAPAMYCVDSTGFAGAKSTNLAANDISCS